MDGVDFAIVARLHENPFASNAALAASVGVSAATVGKRRRRLKDDGIGGPALAIPRPAAFGRIESTHGFPPRGDVSMDEVLRVADVFLVNEREDGSFVALEGVAPERGVQNQGLVAMLGAANYTATSAPAPGPPPLTAADYRVVGALLEAPEGTAQEQAGLARSGTRSLRRRKAELLKRGWVRGAMELDLSVARGITVFELAVHFRMPKASEQAARFVRDGITLGASGDLRNHYFFCHAASPQNAFKEAGRIQGHPDVEATIPVFPSRRKINVARLREWATEAELRLAHGRRT